MFSPKIAEQLVSSHGVDATAIVTERGIPDDAVLAQAIAENRIVVTNDLKDFVPMASRLLGDEATIPGIVLVPEKRFPRGRPSTPGQLVLALAELASSGRGLSNQLHWLEPR